MGAIRLTGKDVKHNECVMMGNSKMEGWRTRRKAARVRPRRRDELAGGSLERGERLVHRLSWYWTIESAWAWG
jgi:hypothetical protein